MLKIMAFMTALIVVAPIAEARDNHTPSRLSERFVIRDQSGRMTGTIRQEYDGRTYRYDRGGNRTGGSRFEQGRTVQTDRFGNRIGSVGR
jgi:hypothetical protein